MFFLDFSCHHPVLEKLQGERTLRGLHWFKQRPRRSQLLPHLAVAKKPLQGLLMEKKMEKRQQGKQGAERAGPGSENPTIPLRRRRIMLLQRRNLSHHQPHDSQSRVKPPPRSSIPGTASHLPAAQRQRSAQLQGHPVPPHLVSASTSPSKGRWLSAQLHVQHQFHHLLPPILGTSNLLVFLLPPRAERGFFCFEGLGN